MSVTVNRPRKSSDTQFIDLPPGTVFRHQSGSYIRVSGGAISLASFHFSSLEEDWGEDDECLIVGMVSNVDTVPL